MRGVLRRVREADARQDDQDHGDERGQVEAGDDVVGPKVGNRIRVSWVNLMKRVTFSDHLLLHESNNSRKFELSSS